MHGICTYLGPLPFKAIQVITIANILNSAPKQTGAVFLFKENGTAQAGDTSRYFELF